jgi:Tfp pilus assembly protein PilV
MNFRFYGEGKLEMSRARAVGEKGFTVIEVVAAGALLLCFLLAAAALQTMGLRATNVLNDTVMAEQICNNIFTEVLIRPDVIPAGRNGISVLMGREFSWNVEVADTEESGIVGYAKEITVTCTWQGNAGQRSVERKRVVAFSEFRRRAEGGR